MLLKCVRLIIIIIIIIITMIITTIIIIIIIMTIITLFGSQIILAEHESCNNWGDYKSNKSNQIKCWFLWRGENRSSRRKTSRSRVENQQTQPTYDAGSGNRTRDTLVEGERSHHYANHRRTGTFGLGWAVTTLPEKNYTMPESMCCTKNALKSQ